MLAVSWITWSGLVGGMEEGHYNHVVVTSLRLESPSQCALNGKTCPLVKMSSSVIGGGHLELNALDANGASMRKGCLKQSAADAATAEVAMDAHAKRAAVLKPLAVFRSDVAPANDLGLGNGNEHRLIQLNVR